MMGEDERTVDCYARTGAILPQNSDIAEMRG